MIRFRFLPIISIFLLLASFAPGFAAPLAQTDDAKDRAQALLDTLTPEERVGQLFLITFIGTDVSNPSQIYDLIVNHHVGGVILQAANDNFASHPQTIPSIFQLTRQLQTAEWSASQSNQADPVTTQEFTPAFIPLFIGISQEGDDAPYDQILNGLTPLPSQLALGATWNPDLSQQVGAVLGDELSALGFNLLLGPSLDVLENPHPQGSGDLGVRTFGGDPFWVGEMGRAYVRGVHQGSQGRLAVIAKNFPGHGGSDRLPEEEVATVRKVLEQLEQIELPPFFAVTGNAPSPDATADGLLASHIRYQGFQGNMRETTRPVSLDPQAFGQLMSLPAFSLWRENGGVMVSDDLGSRPLRRFLDPTGENFSAHFIARDAFLTGNDLLYLGQDFIGSTYADYHTTVLRTLDLFAQKYRQDPAFAQRVDASVLRILTLKHRLYTHDFILNQVLPAQNRLNNLGKSGQVTFQVAQEAATLIDPSLTNLANAIPEPPGLNDRIVFLTDERKAQQCRECAEQPLLARNALELAVVRLYGPMAAGQVLQRNLESYSYAELQALLDHSEDMDTTGIEDDLRQANWIVFCSLNVTTHVPTSQTLSRFLAERPDLFRQKKLIVFAFNVPYFLDSTEVSKITAFYGLYSKAAPFVEVAARLLFGELPNPPGSLPVSVGGVGYDLISATAPHPTQVIPLMLDFPEPAPPEGNSTPEPTPVVEFQRGGLIPLRTGVILDHNGHAVPDDTPVQFVMKAGENTLTQIEKTRSGVARTTFLVNSSGSLEIRVESDPARQSYILTFEIPSENGEVTPPTPTPTPTVTVTLTPSPTTTPLPQATPTPTTRAQTNMGDWFLALVVAGVLAGGVYWLTALDSALRWGIRAGLLSISGGLLGYTYLAMGLPGSAILLQNTGRWGVLLFTVLGCLLGWVAGLSWEKIHRR